MRPIYCTREQVKTALDSVETARNNRQIDRLMASGADSVDQLTQRVFYPTLATRTRDWPVDPVDLSPRSWNLWLDQNELAGQPTQVTVDGVAVDLATVMARPDEGPPYDRLEFDRSKNTAWSSGATPQRAITVTGLFGYQSTEILGPGLAVAVTDTTGVTIQVTPIAEVGVGSILRVGTERMIVTGRSLVTTGQTLQVPVDNTLASTSVKVTDGTGFVEDEVVTLDSERMRVEDIAGNTLIVKRAWDGTVLAAHNGATIYAPRRCTVTRGALGATAATHAQGDPVWLFQAPPLINQLNIAEAVVGFLQESAGYARMVGAGDNMREAAGRQLTDLRRRVANSFYRPRSGAV